MLSMYLLLAPSVALIGSARLEILVLPISRPPPINTDIPIPTPPVTTSAPVVVDVELVAFDIVVTPAIPTVDANVAAPVTPKPPATFTLP